MDPNQLMQIIQMLSQQQGGGGMGMGGMGMGMGGTAMPQMALPQMQGPTGPATRVIPAAPMAPMGGGHSTSWQDLLGGGQPQQPSTQTGTPLQSVQGPDPSTLGPGLQSGITQMQSPVPLQAAQGPGVEPLLQGAQGVQPDQSRLGPSGGGDGGIASTLGTYGTNMFNNILAKYGLGPNAQTGPATKVNAPFSPAYTAGHNFLHLGSIIGAALGAAA